ncbi:glycosyltransferase [Jutongia sp.]|uniref:glycosyltransferase family protein n=1 Tax=Jutongia sp. TaxID=2944204 RepID=UPI0030794D8A
MVNVPRLDQLRQTKKVIGLKQKKYDISFVGSLYENNYYEQITYLPAHLKGYLDGICRAQMQLFGVDLLPELLHEDILIELKKYVKLDMDQTYLVTYGRLFSDLFLKKYISSMERKERLELLAKIRQVALFSGSHWAGEGIDCYGTVDYMNEMPLVFSLSKININMTIRSITSGIPLRCMDILGAGGFLFSNYQPELEEYFVPEREWVSFQEAEEMLDKVVFYLQHDELRDRIAENGFQKVKREFTYDKALEKMLGIVRKLM